MSHWREWTFGDWCAITIVVSVCLLGRSLGAYTADRLWPASHYQTCWAEWHARDNKISTVAIGDGKPCTKFVLLYLP